MNIQAYDNKMRNRKFQMHKKLKIKIIVINYTYWSTISLNKAWTIQGHTSCTKGCSWAGPLSFSTWIKLESKFEHIQEIQSQGKVIYFRQWFFFSWRENYCPVSLNSSISNSPNSIRHEISKLLQPNGWSCVDGYLLLFSAHLISI